MTQAALARQVTQGPRALKVPRVLTDLQGQTATREQTGPQGLQVFQVTLVHKVPKEQTDQLVCQDQLVCLETQG